MNSRIRICHQWRQQAQGLSLQSANRHAEKRADTNIVNRHREKVIPVFAEQFRGMTETEIDLMMQSHAFDNCQLRRELFALPRRTLSSCD